MTRNHPFVDPAAAASISAESMLRLSPDAISARSIAAIEREDQYRRQATARALADRVAAVPARPVPEPAPAPIGAQGGAQPVSRATPVPTAPVRTGPIVVPLGRRHPEPVDLTADELRLIARAVERERQADQQRELAAHITSTNGRTTPPPAPRRGGQTGQSGKSAPVRRLRR